MQCDEQSPWQWIKQKIIEFSQQNEGLRILLDQIGSTLLESIKAKNAMSNGTYQMDCQYWADCKKYIDIASEWLNHNMECMRNINENITGIIGQLRQTLDQQIEHVTIRTTQWKTDQRWALIATEPTKDTSVQSEQTVPGFDQLSLCYEKMEKGIESLSILITQYSLSFEKLSHWGYLSPMTTHLQMERINFCEQIKKDIGRMERTLVERVLAGASYGILRCNVQVEIFLISENRAKDIMTGKFDQFQPNLPTSGELSKTVAILQGPDAQTDGKITAVFKTVRVKSMNNHNADEIVPLYHILFRTKPFRLNDGADSTLQLWTISLPFTILSNAHRQDKLARARMFWHLSFKTDDQTSLATVVHYGDDGNEIQWKKFFPALDTWFRKTLEKFRKDSNGSKVICRRGLDEHCEYIADRLGVTVPVNPDSLVTWDAFYKRKTGDAYPTFWKWLCSIADYVAKAPEYWESGLICGFVSRREAERLLYEAKIPAMVLRFSERNPGKMVVSYFLPDKNIMEHVLFDERENKALEGKTLAKCIQLSQNLGDVEHILPANKPITDLFALDTTQTVNEANPPNKQKTGYVEPAVALVWDPPPTPPECLMNISIQEDMVYEKISMSDESLDEDEFTVAGRSLSEYLELADDFERGSRIMD